MEEGSFDNSMIILKVWDRDPKSMFFAFRISPSFHDHQDMDVVVFKDPLKFMYQWPDADFMVEAG